MAESRGYKEMHNNMNHAWTERRKDGRKRHLESVNRYHEIINRNCYRTQGKEKA